MCWLFTPDVMEQIASLGQVIPSQLRQAKAFLNQVTPPYSLNALVRSMDFVKRFHLDHPAAPYITSAYLSGANPIYVDMVAGRVPVATALPEIAWKSMPIWSSGGQRASPTGIMLSMTPPFGRDPVMIVFVNDLSLAVA